MRLGVLGAGAIACDMAPFLAKAGHYQFAQLLRYALSAAAAGTEGVSLPINVWGMTLLTGRQQADQPSLPHHRPTRMVARGQPVLGGDGPQSRGRQRPFVRPRARQAFADGTDCAL